MKKVLLVLMLMVGLAMTAQQASAAVQMPKTTGGVVVGLNGTRTNIGFEAMSASPTAPRGTLTWVRSGDIWANKMTGKVIAASVAGDDAEFTIQITKSSNFPEWVGWQLKFYVHDGGTSGVEGDTISWQWVTGPYVGGAYGEPVMAGNLQVMP
jgi:hypothetical protein